jgi:hypothetical protein
MTARKAAPTAREKIVTTALASGWTTAPGYRETADRSVAWAGNGPDGRTVNVEFSIRGAITYAAVGTRQSVRRLAESGRLALVLAHIWNHRVASPAPELPVLDQLRAVENAYAKGGSAAAADAQACKLAANGTIKWRSREHTVPADADERAAWMRGYGKVFAYWGGDKGDVS